MNTTLNKSPDASLLPPPFFPPPLRPPSSPSLLPAPFYLCSIDKYRDTYRNVLIGSLDTKLDPKVSIVHLELAVWCGVVCSAVLWCVLLCCGVFCCAVVCAVFCCAVVWCDVVWCGVCCVLLCCAVVWCGVCCVEEDSS